MRRIRTIAVFGDSILYVNLEECTSHRALPA
jgi:hypothetical protein